MPQHRSIAQPGRVLRSGRRGRGFEPRYSDHKIKIGLVPVFILCMGYGGDTPHCETMSVRQ